MDIEDIIRFENENTALDFKATQYVKKQYESLIKDIMAMANSSVVGNKYIIIGVKQKSSGDKEFYGIEKSDFVDSATYQQIILENIEPSISVDYFPYTFKNKTLGIFEISNCFDRPYMMKKDYGNLKKGDSFIRKGSQQSRMVRRDFDQIINSRNIETSLEKVISIYFDGYPEEKQIELSPVKKFKLPSEKAKDEIIRILKKRKEPNLKYYPGSLSSISQMGYLLRVNSYENSTTEELESDLKNVKEIYKDDDCYEMFELNSHKLNIIISNKGDRYLEDCTIEVNVKKKDGFIIVPKIYTKPIGQMEMVYRGISQIKPDFYPDVKSNKNIWVIKQHIGDIKHQMPTKGFQEKLRVFITNNTIGESIDFECKLFARNLNYPLQQNLTIKIVDRK